MNIRQLFPSLVLAFSICQVSADVTDKLIGDWTGRVSTKYQGNTAEANIHQSFERFQKKGLIVHSTVKLTGQPKAKSISKYYDSGNVEGVTLQSGQTTSVFEGKWWIEDNKLVVKTKVTALANSFSQTTTTVLLNPRKFSTVMTSSIGVRGTGQAHKN